MAATQLGTGSLVPAGQTALAAVFIDIPANAIVESCTVNYGGAPDYEDITDAEGAFHTRLTYNGAGHADFTGGGTAEPLRGCKLTGASSGAEAYILGVHLTGGTWAGGDAAGTFALSGLKDGTAFTAENVDVSGAVTQLNVATLSAGLAVVGMHTATVVLIGAKYTTEAGVVDGIVTNEQYYIESVSEENSKSIVRTTINLTLLPTEIA